MGSYILGGCIAIYIGAYLLRWGVKAYTTLTDADPVPHNVRYATIGAATVLLLILVAIVQSSLAEPDYSVLWIYPVSGAIVFTLSVGHAYWRRERAHRTEHDGANQLVGFDPWGYKWSRPPARDIEEASPFDTILGWALASVFLYLVLTEAGYDSETDAIIGFFLAPVIWLGEGFVTAITNPFYLGGLLIGIGTGWILRGALGG